MTNKYCFIGGGNMAKALIGGLIRSNVQSSDIYVTDPSPIARNDCKSSFKVQTFESAAKAVLGADILILAVKPNVVTESLIPIKEVYKPECLLISVAAGIRLSTLELLTGNNMAIARAMSNTPALVGRGATAVKANDQVKSNGKKVIEKLFGSVGLIRWVDDEDLLDAVTAISGSGPAYFFLFAELLEKAAVEVGLSKELARDLASETFCGSATLFDQTRETAATLRAHVTSPGGTTEKALESFDKSNLYDCFLKAVEAALEKSKALSEQ